MNEDTKAVLPFIFSKNEVVPPVKNDELATDLSPAEMSSVAGGGNQGFVTNPEGGGECPIGSGGGGGGGLCGPGFTQCTITTATITFDLKTKIDRETTCDAA